ncbi:unnamed protein product [Clonostachys rosea]|uniref:Uncharacterized protein n=1 Tax=Bionectria ochroleuca TaxID=29856 RepID=A0ABY6V237_BIOOC|nr:unnamed protein product [Clonostachys rosea]
MTPNTDVAAQPLARPWDVLARWLPPRTPDCDYWWQLTGPHLATMMELAGYGAERQFEALLFHYHWVVPYLGPQPNPDGTVKWKSLLGAEGSPIEYSWKWNQPGGQPEVRHCFEAINEFTGTSLDPLNQLANRELLHRLQEPVKSLNLEWCNHFVATLYDHDLSKYATDSSKGAHVTSTIFTAIEFLQNSYLFKTYFLPRKIGQFGPASMSVWKESLAGLELENEARASLYDFLDNNEQGKLLSPFMIAVDDVEPAASRLKLYFQTPRTSFNSIREVMSLGGKIQVPEKSLRDLRDLIVSAAGLADDFPDDAELPLPEYNPAAADNFTELPILLQGSLYYFDIALGAKTESLGIKYYASARRYAGSDLSWARGVMSWMRSKGRGEYCDKYLSLLESFSPHRSLGGDTGIQAYMSCMFKAGGELDVTSYVSPEAFHPNRQNKK